MARLAGIRGRLRGLNGSATRSLKKFSTPLLGLSLLETGYPLIRILILTHLLSLREVGFATILTAFVSILELSTDIAVHRFIYSAPRDKFDEAMSAVHALAIARGFFLGAIGLCAAPIVAASLSLGADWRSFAWLAPTLILRSFAHLGPKVAERDFQYGAQIKSSFAGYGSALAVLFVVGAITHSHVAVIFSTYAFDLAAVIATRMAAGSPFRFNFRSPLFKQALKFAYPLMFNGMGLAVSVQADRFLVAGLFDLQIVAIYAIIITTATYPAQVITRFFSTTIVARLYHANESMSRLLQEVRLASSLSAVTGAFYGGGVTFLTNITATNVFGHKFHVSNGAMALLGLAAYVRFIRQEPFSSLMLNFGRTKRLAASNFLVSATLVYLVVIAMFNRSMEAIVLTRLMGEATALFFTIYIARHVSDGGSLVFSRSTIIGLGFVGAACLSVMGLPWLGQSVVATLAACVVYTIAIAIWAAWELRAAKNRQAALSPVVGKANRKEEPPAAAGEPAITSPGASGVP